MSETKFTPGPWFTCKGDFADQVCSKPEYDKAIAAGESDETACGESLVCETASNLANARLIASAPELLAALEGLVSDWERVHGKMPEDHEARQAIAKAKGQL